MPCHRLCSRLGGVREPRRDSRFSEWTMEAPWRSSHVTGKCDGCAWNRVFRSQIYLSMAHINYIPSPSGSARLKIGGDAAVGSWQGPQAPRCGTPTLGSRAVDDPPLRVARTLGGFCDALSGVPRLSNPNRGVVEGDAPPKPRGDAARTEQSQPHQQFSGFGFSRPSSSGVCGHVCLLCSLSVWVDPTAVRSITQLEYTSTVCCTKYATRLPSGCIGRVISSINTKPSGCLDKSLDPCLSSSCRRHAAGFTLSRSMLITSCTSSVSSIRQSRSVF